MIEFDLSSFCTRMGLILDCLAFFLVTPELLGEKRLHILQRLLRSVLLWVSLGLLIVGILTLTLIAMSYLFLPILLAVFPVTMWTASALLVFFLIEKVPLSAEFIWLSGHTLLFLIGGLGALFSWSANKLMGAVVYLCSEEQARRLLMKLGVILFMLGALLQFWGTFQ